METFGRPTGDSGGLVLITDSEGDRGAVIGLCKAKVKYDHFFSFYTPRIKTLNLN